MDQGKSPLDLTGKFFDTICTEKSLIYIDNRPGEANVLAGPGVDQENGIQGSMLFCLTGQAFYLHFLYRSVRKGPGDTPAAFA